MKLKNIVILILVKILALFTKKNKINLKSLKVLVLSTTGLGDTLWAEPFVKEIKKHFPNSKISFFTSPLGKQVLKANPHIDDFFVFKKSKLFSIIKILKRQKIQIVFHLHTSQRLVLPIAAVIGAQKIVGYKRKTKGLDFLLTDSLYEKKTHEIEKRLRLLKFLKIFSIISSPKYYFENELIKKSSQELKILIHPGAKDSYKTWPIKSYISLAKLYLEKYKAKVFFSFGFADKRLKDISLNASETFFIIDSLTISNFANEILNMDLMITNDTGPMHLAASIGTPTIGIFSATDPKISGPIGKNAVSVYRKKTCTPCLARKCNEPFCFYQISPKEIFDVSRSFLDK